MIPSIPSSPAHDALLARLATCRAPTPQEIAAQRRFFVRAEMGFGSDRQEAEYEAAVVAGDQEKIARLDREAQVRMDAADAWFDEQGLT